MLSNRDYIILHLKRRIKEFPSIKDDLSIFPDAKDDKSHLIIFPFENSEDRLTLTGEGIYINNYRVSEWTEIWTSGTYSLTSKDLWENLTKLAHWTSIKLFDGSIIELAGLKHRGILNSICNWIGNKNLQEGRRPKECIHYFWMLQNWRMALMRYKEFNIYSKFVKFNDFEQYAEIMLSSTGILRLTNEGMLLNNERIVSWDNYWTFLPNYDETEVEFEGFPEKIVIGPPCSINIIIHGQKFLRSIYPVNDRDFDLYSCLVEGLGHKC